MLHLQCKIIIISDSPNPKFYETNLKPSLLKCNPQLYLEIKIVAAAFRLNIGLTVISPDYCMD